MIVVLYIYLLINILDRMLKLVYKIARYVFIVHDNIAFYFTEGVVDLEKKLYYFWKLIVILI